LKASANFQQLQGDLNNIEDQLQLARRYYNGTVRDYNVAIQQFPSSVVAGMGGFTAQPFFQVDNSADRDVPKVSFTTRGHWRLSSRRSFSFWPRPRWRNPTSSASPTTRATSPSRATASSTSPKRSR
ncbi:MAG TPA: LemA family protein, partial [Rhizomicrobium sp.]|nr:LemA family protein [Rhizomicrobium sp.]